MNSMSTQSNKSVIRLKQIHPYLCCDMANWGDSHLMHLYCCTSITIAKKTSVTFTLANYSSLQFHSPSSLNMSNKRVPFLKGGKDQAVVSFFI